jgi:hypothetical protein
MAGKPDAYITLDWQADAFAFSGQLRRSQDFSQQAVRQSLATGAKGPDLIYRAKAAFRSAVLEQCTDDRSEALRVDDGDIDREALEYVALASALCGDENRTQMAVRAMSKNFSESTLVNMIALPEVAAARALHNLTPQEAIDTLQITRRYEAAAEFRPQYLRGLAYLQLKSPREAFAEFQRILDHRGQAPLSVLYPMAQLGLGRSAALGGDAVKARKAYEDFFTFWKNADPELNPLRTAKQEYQRLATR